MFTFGLIRRGPRLANVCLGLVQLTVSIMVPNYEQHMNTMIKIYIKKNLIVACVLFLNDITFQTIFFICDIYAHACDLGSHVRL